MDSARASMVTVLKVNPMTGMKPKVATTEIGRAMALISVARRSRRNKAMTSTVKSAP